MKILYSLSSVRSWASEVRKTFKTIGLVPTMGALHEGHLALVEKAKQSTDFVVVSIFVNPTQFNNPEDFAKYPKTLEKDLEMLISKGVDAVFVPSNEEMYPRQPKLSIDFGDLERTLEGAFRPGHFSGVGIVVSKLLNIVKPDRAFFGQKDLQQVAIIRRLVEDLSFDVELVVVPTVREEDGLALSSRNMRLSESERKEALVLFRSMEFAKKELLAGADWLEVKEKARAMFASVQNARLEYFEWVDSQTFEPIGRFSAGQASSICTACYIGEVRLIDNLSVND